MNPTRTALVAFALLPLPLQIFSASVRRLSSRSTWTDSRRFISTTHAPTCRRFAGWRRTARARSGARHHDRRRCRLLVRCPASKESGTPTGSTKGTHGNLPKNPLLDASLVAWGAGIKPGVALKRIRNVDVAPNMAAVSALKMEDVEGRVLTELLKQ